MNQRILITGGSGLLGSYLIRWFRQKGYSHITATYQTSLETIPEDIREGIQWQRLSLPDKEVSFEIIEGHDWVIHAAGLISYHPKDKFRLLEINKTGTAHIVNACLAHGVSHFLYVGSISALGRETDHVTLNESSPWLDNKFSTGYGLSKYLGELEAWRGAGEGLNVSVILPSVILGAGDWHKSSLKLVDRIATRAGWYPGGQTGFVDVRDITFFIGSLLEKSMTGERWILNGANLKIEDLYHQFGRYLAPDKSFRKAPKWLAQAILMGGNILKGGGFGLEMLNQSYGTFSYDARKSLTLDGFTYRKIEETIREFAHAYQVDGR